MKNCKAILFQLSLLLYLTAFSQPQFSISTDFFGSHSLRKEQRFFTFGQTIQGQLHTAPKDGAYVSYSYSSPGKFKNELVATAKSQTTTPQEINFTSSAELDLNHFSIGWKHYLKGTYNSDESWNLYITAGFGLMSGKITNTFNIQPDTSRYDLPASPVSGSGRMKRLTFDTALGYEIPIGMAIYLYGEGRAHIPASDYPSKYLLQNSNAPFLVSACVGLRVLFD